MKIIDFKKKGNVVRFFLGDDKLKKWYGDDWDDAPYEYNAGEVYDEFISGYTDVAFSFDDLVLEPSDGAYCRNSNYCKDDMIDRRVPCIIVVPKSVHDANANGWGYDDSFPYWLGSEGVTKYYFGDKMVPKCVVLHERGE
jgi:hypothetical protein